MSKMPTSPISRRTLCGLAGSALFLSQFPRAVFAAGGPSGLKVDFPQQGELGEVIGNPYDIAPLTAVIKNGGVVLTKAHVRVVPKKGGVEIAYDVGPTTLRTYGGIPVFGLYPEYLNTVEVTWTKREGGKLTEKAETYRIWTPPVYLDPAWTKGRPVKTFETEIIKPASKEFADRLYLCNNLMGSSPKGKRAVWNNPSGGALEWNSYPQNAILDTQGEVRWFLQPQAIYDPRSIYRAGLMMGFHQNADGALSFGYGQTYAKYDLLGREIFNRRLPEGYADFSHAMAEGPNGHYFLRVSSADLRRADGTHVHTVRDVVIEVDASGRVVDEWRLFEILDPNRSIVLKAIDQGAVCLNVDLSKTGETLSAEQLAKLEAKNAFGDIPGTGAGRNWAHVNSVDYDPTDDSIILSARHQGIVKIGRDHQVKWILASPVGWKKGLAERVLTPVDKNSKPLKCEGSQCEGGFDWSWTQHTAWRIDSKSTKDVIYLSVFDNGDARGMEQPPLPTMKYSRAVVYKIDQKKMTVEQIWEVGKDLGYDYFSPVTGITKYMDDKDTMLVFWSTAGMGASPEKAGKLGRLHPRICEYRWGDKSLAVDLTLWDTCGYQAFPVSFEEAFSKN